MNDTLVSKNFRASELQCSCGCKGLPKPELISRLQNLRDSCGFAFSITSGYRCAEYNTKVGGAFASRHVTGEAVDIAVPVEKRWRLVSEAMRLQWGGIGVAKSFIHLDIRPADEGAVWVYTDK